MTQTNNLYDVVVIGGGPAGLTAGLYLARARYRVLILEKDDFAYQTTINIDGTAVPFWTVATSADQLLGFFEENQNNAAKITVDIKNVYNQLTGGLVINQDGPVTVIADGKTSVAPNGKLPAASILDSKGIVLNK